MTSGNKNEVLCVNSSLPTIKYNGNPGQTLIFIGSRPIGTTFSTDPAAGSAIIKGNPTEIGNFSYSITTDDGCGYKLDGSIVVKANAFINYVSGSGGLDQVACIGTPIETLRYTIPLDVITTNVTIIPSLPTGLSYVAVGGDLIISGTPISTFISTNYSISVNNGCGTPANSIFKLTIVNSPVITLETGSGALSQSVCQNGEILPIKFKLSGGATGIDLSLLPTFITSSFDTATGIYTLTGAPITTGTFIFEIKTTGNSSCNTSKFVTIDNLYAAVSIVRISAPGSDNQILCSFKPIIPIVYDVIGNVTISDIKVKSLPGGVTTAIITTTTGVLVTISGTPTASGIFDYGIVYQNCSGAIMSGKISVSPPISVTGKVTPITCVGNYGEIAVTILGGTPFITSGNPYYAIAWTGPNEFMQNQTTITGLSSGDYKLKVVDAIGCTSPDVTYTLAPSSPINVLLKSQTSMSCNGTLGCANFSITGGTGIYTSFLLQYFDPSSQVWKTIIPANNNYFNICGLKAGDYELTATDSNNCKNTPFPFDIKDDSLLSIKSIALDTQLCANTPGKIRVEVNNSNSNPTFFYNSVLVSSNALGNNTYELLIINPKTSGILTVKSQSCLVSKIVTTATLMPGFGFTSDEFKKYNYFSVNSSIEFTNIFDTSKIPDGNRVVWSFGDNTPSKVFYSNDKDSNSDGESFKTVFHTYTTSGIFEVTLALFNSSGCFKSITKSITIESGNTIMIPTAFSPNDDGYNDFFSPYLIGFKEVSIYIYDNWSNLVYEGNLDVQLGPKEDWGWNGIEKGNTEPKNGTYRYYIMAKTIDNKIIQKKGEFLLIK